MPGSYYCETCNDYHSHDEEPEDDYDDDYDEAPEQRLMPPVGFPDTPSAVLWASGDSFSEMMRSGRPSRSVDGYAQNPRAATTPNAHGWAWDYAGQCYVVFEVPCDASGRPVPNVGSTFNTWSRTAPPEAWCKHASTPPPFPYVGQYIAIHYNTESGAYRLISETRHDCPHCAFIAANAVPCTGYWVPKIVLCHQDQPIPENMMPVIDEIIGMPPPGNTSTVKDVAEPIPTACGNCGMVGHRSTGCTRAPKSFKKVGIEIEGRFLDLDALMRKARNEGLDYAGDSSISYSPDNDACRAMEFKTQPGSVREACQQLVDYYPDETDSSCGMHVHVSFDAVDISLLNTTEFFNYFKTRWEAWGARMNLAPNSHFFRRLQGNNSFCRVVTRPVDYNRQDRYSQLNFSAWVDHKTVECRLLPMFRRASLGVAAVQELLCIYEDYLANPAAHGVVFPENTTSLVAPAVLKHEYKREMEFSELLSSSLAREMELTEVQPPADGMVRIAIPVNNAITIQTLADAVRRARAA